MPTQLELRRAINEYNPGWVSADKAPILQFPWLIDRSLLPSCKGISVSWFDVLALQFQKPDYQKVLPASEIHALTLPLLNLIVQSGIPITLDESINIHLIAALQSPPSRSALQAAVNDDRFKDDFISLNATSAANGILLNYANQRDLDLRVPGENDLDRLRQHLVQGVPTAYQNLPERGRMGRFFDHVFPPINIVNGEIASGNETSVDGEVVFALSKGHSRISTRILATEYPGLSYINQKPYISIRWGQFASGRNFLRITFFVDADPQPTNVREKSSRLVILKYDITSLAQTDHTRYGSISWDQVQSRVITRGDISENIIHLPLRQGLEYHREIQQAKPATGEEPWIVIDQSGLETLTSPIKIDEADLQALKKEPLELVAAAARIVGKCTEAENNLLISECGKAIYEQAFQNDPELATPAISETTLSRLQEEIDYLAQTDEQTGKTHLQLAIEQAKAKSPQNKEFDLEYIQTFMTAACDINPGRWWRYFSKLGLYKLFPALHHLTPHEIQEINRRLHEEQYAETALWNLFYFADPNSQFIVDNPYVHQEYKFDQARFLATYKSQTHRLYNEGWHGIYGILHEFTPGMDRIRQILIPYLAFPLNHQGISALIIITDVFNLEKKIKTDKAKLITVSHYGLDSVDGKTRLVCFETQPVYKRTIESDKIWLARTALEDESKKFSMPLTGYFTYTPNGRSYQDFTLFRSPRGLIYDPSIDRKYNQVMHAIIRKMNENGASVYPLDKVEPQPQLLKHTYNTDMTLNTSPPKLPLYRMILGLYYDDFRYSGISIWEAKRYINELYGFGDSARAQEILLVTAGSGQLKTYDGVIIDVWDEKDLAWLLFSQALNLRKESFFIERLSDGGVFQVETPFCQQSDLTALFL